jgi:hypothetical protein
MNFSLKSFIILDDDITKNKFMNFTSQNTAQSDFFEVLSH